MCGIAGILDLGSGRAPTASELEAMNESLRHRGPDDAGLFVQGDVGLGHTRLSIVDLAGGRQPMSNEDDSIWVVFNGEIFNHVELRAELVEQGHRFRTRSDTEVIVHAYEEHGLGFVERFNGQFAIALWDARKRTLVLARDRVGVRPLFYTHAGGRLFFASEVKALFQHPEIPRRLDRDALGDVFHFWSPLEPRTPFEGIRQLPPGHLLVVRDGVEELHRFWDWQFPDEDGLDLDRSIESWAEELRALLVDAVRLRLRADVPVGAYLSGGLDSSIITSIIKRFTETPLRTFSIGFEDAEFDESRHQAELVAHLETDHTAVRCTKADIGRAFPTTIWHAEAPLVRTAPTPLLLLAGTVRASGYKVVLTGEGADEVFAGYDLFKEAKVRRFWARRPGSPLRPRLLERLYPYLPRSPVAASAYAQSFFRQGFERAAEPFFGHLPRFSTTRRIWHLFRPELRAALERRDLCEELRARLPADIGRWAPLCRDQYVEGHTLLSGYLLSSQGDRVGMASAVEGRFPFLDVRVMELASRIPPQWKLMGLREKHVLRRAFGDLLPRSIARRPKQPYRAPDSQSFFRDGRALPYVAELLSAERLRSSGLFDEQAVALLFEKCRAGRAIGFVDNMAFVGVLSTMLLDEMFVRRRGPFEA